MLQKEEVEDHCLGPTPMMPSRGTSTTEGLTSALSNATTNQCIFNVFCLLGLRFTLSSSLLKALSIKHRYTSILHMVISCWRDLYHIVLYYKIPKQNIVDSHFRKSLLMSDLERVSHEKVKQCCVLACHPPWHLQFLCSSLQCIERGGKTETAPYFKRTFSLEVFLNYL